MRGTETDVIAAIVDKLATYLGAVATQPANWPEGSTSNQPAVLAFTDSWTDADGVAHAAELRTLPVYVGRKHLPGHEAPFRVVIYFGRDRTTGATSPSQEAESLPRTLETRRPELTVQCWGGDYGETGALYQAVRNAIHDAATDPATLFNYASLGGEFEVEGAGGAWTQSGEALYHAFEIEIPVVSPRPPTTLQGPPELTEVIE